MTSPQLTLFVPDRFDSLIRRVEPSDLNQIVTAVEPALEWIDDIFTEMTMAGRGAFRVVYGTSGSGKSTFLNTIGLFREGVESFSLPADLEIGDSLGTLVSPAGDLRVLVVDGREALTDTSKQELESSLHAINGFLRSRHGERTLVVWPCNKADLRDSLTDLASEIGAEALLGLEGQHFTFEGPQKAEYQAIATQTIAVLNQGASLADLGVSAEKAVALTQKARTIGKYLALVRAELARNRREVEKLLAKEKCLLWIVVAASNDPDNDVDALTRGSEATADVDRLLHATNANVVAELKAHPEKLGILSTVLSARILHLPALAALDLARMYGDKTLHARMKAEGLTTTVRKGKKTPEDRLAESALADAFLAQPSGVRRRGKKIGTNTEAAFKKLAAIASSDDASVNRSIAQALLSNGYIDGFEIEDEFGSVLSLKTDVLARAAKGPMRLEFMWRAKTSRAEIANYTLTKMYNYGRAVGFLPL